MGMPWVAPSSRQPRKLKGLLVALLTALFVAAPSPALALDNTDQLSFLLFQQF